MYVVYRSGINGDLIMWSFEVSSTPIPSFSTFCGFSKHWLTISTQLLCAQSCSIFNEDSFMYIQWRFIHLKQKPLPYLQWTYQVDSLQCVVYRTLFLFYFFNSISHLFFSLSLNFISHLLPLLSPLYIWCFPILRIIMLITTTIHYLNNKWTACIIIHKIYPCHLPSYEKG